MGKLVIKFKKYWPLLLVASLTYLLRAWKINELFYFTYDESIPAFVGRRLILWHHIPLIGGVTPFNFHLGPYFYWLYALLLFFSNLDPIIWGWASAVIAAITTSLIFIIGKHLGGKRLAFTAATLWSFSFLANIYDRHLWALYWGPIISLVVIYSLLKIIKGNQKYTYLLGLTIAVGIHADLSNLIFLILGAVIWIIYKLPLKKSTFLSLLFIPLFMLPLLVFDLRHNFSNTKPVQDFVEIGKKANKPGFSVTNFKNNSLLFPKTFTRLIYAFGDNEIAKQYSYCRDFVTEKYKAIPPLFIFLSSLVLLFAVATIVKNKKNPITVICLLQFLLYYIGIQIYGTLFRADIFEHYITGLFPVFILFASVALSLLPRKIWLIFLSIFIFFNLYKLSMAKNNHGLIYKRQAITFTDSYVQNSPFSLESLSTCWRYSGYRYLFAVYAKEPVKSYVDPNFGYLYGTTPIAQKHPSIVAALVTHDFKEETQSFYHTYATYKTHEVKNAVFGNIEVIIMDNSTGWFDNNQYKLK